MATIHHVIRIDMIFPCSETEASEAAQFGVILGLIKLALQRKVQDIMCAVTTVACLRPSSPFAHGAITSADGDSARALNFSYRDRGPSNQNSNHNSNYNSTGNNGTCSSTKVTVRKRFVEAQIR